jgi:hypothetical protein
MRSNSQVDSHKFPLDRRAPAFETRSPDNQGLDHIMYNLVSGIVGPIVDRQYSPLEVNTDITTF